VNLVTGGAGFIGSHLVEALVRAGEKVRVLDDLSSGRRENLAAVAGKVELLEGSVADPAAVRRAVAGATRVFHLAARPSVAKSFEEPEQAHEVNATGTLHVVVEAAKAGAKRLIFAGSCAVYGDAGTGPVREEARLDPKSPYAAQKLLGESYCRQLCGAAELHPVVLRFFNVYGPRQDPGSPYSGVISVFCEKMLRGVAPVIYGDGRQTRDFVGVDDVVQALTKAAGAGVERGATFNIASGRSRSVLELHAALAAAIGARVAPTFAKARVGDIVHSAADITRAQRDLCYEPASRFEDGLARTIAWYRARTGG
jgi:nucleoside-diphosphate-sugar epimerase